MINLYRKEYTEKHKEIAELEAKIYRLSEIIGPNRNATIENVQRKQARTGEEREEDEDDFVNENDSDDEDEEVVYNPKNLPLGWDGKPIPYWLYKLHGLNLYYSYCVHIIKTISIVDRKRFSDTFLSGDTHTEWLVEIL